jgi:hypothetical protein
MLGGFKKNKFIALGFLCAAVLVACSDPKMDASSDQTMKESMEKMATALPADKKQEFEEAVANVILSIVGTEPPSGETSISAMEEKLEAVRKETHVKLHGKTAREIIAMAEEFRENTK